MRVLPGHGDYPADILLAVHAQIVPGEGHPATLRVDEPQEQVRHRALARAARAEERDPAPRLEAQAEAVERRRLARRVARADVLELDDDGSRRQRQRLLRVGDRRLPGRQLEHPSAAGEGRTELAGRLRKRLNRLEGGEGEQRQQRDQHPVEAARGVRRDRHREHADDRGPGQHQPEPVSGSVGERGSSRNPDELVVGGANAAQAIVLAAVRRNLRAARERFDPP